MAKAKPKPVQDVYERDIQSLAPSKTFVYDVSIYCYTDNGFFLYDSKYVSASAEQADINEPFKKGAVSFKRQTTMVGAPLEWLKTKGYIDKSAK